jgi:hypothetical protein
MDQDLELGGDLAPTTSVAPVTNAVLPSIFIDMLASVNFRRACQRLFQLFQRE